MILSRRHFLLLGSSTLLVLSGCGFALRQPPDFDFTQIHLALPESALGIELRRQLQGIQALDIVSDPAQAQVILESTGEQRERRVVSMNPAGEVREFQLSLRFAFRVLRPNGRELLPATEILREMDQSYSESEALAKEQEEQMLYGNMQDDIIQQVIRQLATIRI